MHQELKEVQLKFDNSPSRGEGEGNRSQLGSVVMKLPKDLSMIDKPYLVKEDIMKSDIDIMYDNFVANHDEMLA